MYGNISILPRLNICSVNASHAFYASRACICVPQSKGGLVLFNICTNFSESNASKNIEYRIRREHVFFASTPIMLMRDLGCESAAHIIHCVFSAKKESKRAQRTLNISKMLEPSMHKIRRHGKEEATSQQLQCFAIMLRVDCI